MKAAMWIETVTPEREEAPPTLDAHIEPPGSLVEKNGRLVEELTGAVDMLYPRAIDILGRAAVQCYRAPAASRRKGLALADLAVTGERASTDYRASPPSDTDVLDAAYRILRGEGVTRDNPRLLAAAREAGERARTVDRFMAATAAERALLRRELAAGPLHADWIAVSGEHDAPARPVNVPMTAYPQRDALVDVGGVTIRTRYVRVGELAAGRPVMLLLHGHSSRLEEYENLIAELAHDCTVLVPDLPSCGYSQRRELSEIPRTETTRALDFLDVWLDAFVRHVFAEADLPPEIACLAGGSLGGNMALRMASRRPPWLRKVAPWSPASVWHSFVCGRDFFKDQALKFSRAAMVPRGGQLAARDEYFREVFENRRPFTDHKGQVRMLVQPDMWYRDGWPIKKDVIVACRREREETYGEAFRQWHWALGHEQLVYSHTRDCTRPGEPDYRSIQVPVLLLAGREDDYSFTNIWSRVRDMGRDWPGGLGKTVLVEHTGHSIHNERPRLLAGLLREHLRGPGPRPAA